MARKHKFTRPDQPEAMRLTPRAQLTLEMVYAWRYVTLYQVQALLYPSYQVAARWMKKLWEHGYLHRIPIPVFSKDAPLIPHCLDTRGAKHLAGVWGMAVSDLDWKPEIKQTTYEKVQHPLLINQVRTVVAALTRSGPVRLVSWIDDYTLHSPAMREKLPFYVDKEEKVHQIRPDGYFCLADSQGHDYHFFLEADRHSLTHAEIAGKVKAYEYARLTGHSEKHFGTSYFRVLSVCLSQARARSMAKTMAKTVARIPHQEAEYNARFYWNTWESRFDLSNPVTFIGPIWTVAGEEQPRPLF
jgi:hypothetical protein